MKVNKRRSFGRSGKSVSHADRHSLMQAEDVLEVLTSSKHIQKGDFRSTWVSKDEAHSEFGKNF
jgi:hypothetical protein